MINNTIGFKPEGKVLKYWTLLPQVSSTIGNDEIPPLFGNLKNILIYQILVGILILTELVLIFYLNTEGVPIIVLTILSIIDFVIAIAPVMYETKPENNYAHLNADVFVKETQLKVESKERKANESGYSHSTRTELVELRKKKTNTKIKNSIVDLIIIAFGASKFYMYFTIFGADIFIEPIGRFIIISILLGIFIHIFCTKVVLYNWLFKTGLRKQINDFNKDNLFKITENQKNMLFTLSYLVNYIPVSSSNQKIRQIAGSETENIEEIMCNGHKKIFKTNIIEGNDNVFLLHTGLLLESEISSLYLAQSDADSKRAIVAACKQIQLAELMK